MESCKDGNVTLWHLGALLELAHMSTLVRISLFFSRHVRVCRMFPCLPLPPQPLLPSYDESFTSVASTSIYH